MQAELWEGKTFEPFDPELRIEVDGKSVRYLDNPEDLIYKHVPDYEIVQENPPLLPPEEHQIVSAVSINIVHTWLKQNLHFLEYIFDLPETLRTHRLLRKSDRFLTGCMSRSAVYNASLIRVLKKTSPERIHLMSPTLQKLVAEIQQPCA
ncbi:hypothetical protein I7V28_19225 [Lelliottia amnigena]|uniref:hypothetical protein n=1 Tax=Lelliottia TaxID=1330545 RepID=UPI00192A7F61|nr:MULTISPECIES: hypothetical protein [Lelliottia]MBL5885637.1 hypothetical protein [Lelliottia aquatilis]MBL5923215.1 hypothetical protein [Lelliottia amnigena]MBL5932125.1 hypothetical protein [Lelliottia amnigena]